MSDYQIFEGTLRSIAETIRAKTYNNKNILCNDFANEISNIKPIYFPNNCSVITNITIYSPYSLPLEKISYNDKDLYKVNNWTRVSLGGGKFNCYVGTNNKIYDKNFIYSDFDVPIYAIDYCGPTTGYISLNFSDGLGGCNLDNSLFLDYLKYVTNIINFTFYRGSLHSLYPSSRIFDYPAIEIEDPRVLSFFPSIESFRMGDFLTYFNEKIKHNSFEGFIINNDYFSLLNNYRILYADFTKFFRYTHMAPFFWVSKDAIDISESYIAEDYANNGFLNGEVYIPFNVRIATNAFKNQKFITECNLPYMPFSLNSTFENCYNLKKIKGINETFLPMLGWNNTFYNCYALEEIQINKFLIQYSSECSRGDSSSVASSLVPSLSNISLKNFPDIGTINNNWNRTAAQTLFDNIHNCPFLESLPDFIDDLTIVERCYDFHFFSYYYNPSFYNCLNLKKLSNFKNLKIECNNGMFNLTLPLNSLNVPKLESGFYFDSLTTNSRYDTFFNINLIDMDNSALNVVPIIFNNYIRTNSSHLWFNFNATPGCNKDIFTNYSLNLWIDNSEYPACNINFFNFYKFHGDICIYSSNNINYSCSINIQNRLYYNKRINLFLQENSNYLNLLLNRENNFFCNQGLDGNNGFYLSYDGLKYFNQEKNIYIYPYNQTPSFVNS